MPQVDSTLTVDPSSIVDADGLPSSFGYQWVRIAENGTETIIAGANDATYTLVAADVGNTIKVVVGFTDNANNSEAVTSEVAMAGGVVVAVVAAAEDCVADRPGNDWCTTMTVGVRTVATSDYAGYEFGSIGALLDRSIDYGGQSFPVAYLQTSKDPDSGNNIEFKIGNNVGFLPRGTVFNFGGEEFTADDASESRVNPGDYGWGDPADLTWIEGQEVTVSANLAPAPESATVNGTTLTLTHAEDLDTGSTPAADSYTVNVNGSAGPTVSSVSVGARTVTLTLATPVTATDIVTVDYDAPTSSPLQDESGLDAPDSENFPVTNNTVASTDATLSALTVDDGTTEHTIDLTAPPYAQTVGSAVAEVTLTATPTHTGASVSAVTLGGVAIDDDDFTDGITVPSLAEGDNVIVVTVTAEDGSTELLYTVTVTREANTPATGTPTISGVPQVDSTLTVDPSLIVDADGLPSTTFPLGYSFQWVRVEGSTETDITGETDITYSPTSADEGSTIKVKVSFTDGAGFSETGHQRRGGAGGCGGGGLRRRPARQRLVHDHDRGGRERAFYRYRV